LSEIKRVQVASGTRRTKMLCKEVTRYYRDPDARACRTAIQYRRPVDRRDAARHAPRHAEFSDDRCRRISWVLGAVRLGRRNSIRAAKQLRRSLIRQSLRSDSPPFSRFTFCPLVGSSARIGRGRRNRRPWPNSDDSEKELPDRFETMTVA